MSTVSSELLATYAGLGTYDGAQYYRGEECHGESLRVASPGRPKLLPTLPCSLREGLDKSSEGG